MSDKPATPEGFVIMQIGNAQLDTVYETVIAPAITAAGLTPRRVDRHNKGHLLKSEIVEFIARADIIVADITNARPNCYLEIGYAMGLGKHTHLILTVREDHHHTSPNHSKSSPRIHFDLEGYDLLFWDPADLPKFQTELETRVKRRLGIVRAARPNPIPVDPNTDAHRAEALAGLAEVGLKGYLEAVVLLEPKGIWRLSELVQAVEETTIRTFGWPIVFVRSGEHRPQFTSSGLRTSVPSPNRPGYDYWFGSRTGDFYLLHSFFEDTRRFDKPVLFFNIRFLKITELLLRFSRLYKRLGIPESTSISIHVTYGGIQRRRLSSVGDLGSQVMIPDHPCVEYDLTTELRTTLGMLEPQLKADVKQLIAPLFELFSYEVPNHIADFIIDEFIAGRVV